MSWLAGTPAKRRQRKATIEAARLTLETLQRYENAWHLLDVDDTKAPILLPSDYRERIDQVGLPEGHPWLAERPGAW